MLKSKVPAYFLIISIVLTAGISYFAFRSTSQPSTGGPASALVSCPGAMEQIRLKDYELTHPLILTDVSQESAALGQIKEKISSYINQAKSSQQADEISVYFRRMNNGAWFTINPNSSYNPASMIKIVYLITYLKEAETNPSVMNKRIFFSKHFSAGNQQNIVDFRLKESSYYTVNDLLVAMIQHSDNDATLLLSQNMNQNVYNQVFKDLDIQLPNPVTEYYINAYDYGKFFRVLYSSTYIRPEYSEYGLKLLSKSTFKEGLIKGIDPSLTVAHKFGERIIGNKSQLHEFGIVFIKDNPYLIGVMTSGSNLKQLTSIVGDISKLAFDEYKNLPG